MSILQVRPEDFWRSEAAHVDVTALLKAGAPPVDGRYRVAALSWPLGMNIGFAEGSGTRGDDPNDLVPHEDRRSLRALKVFASWIALEGLGARNTVDRYVGAPGEGHVVHYFAGLDQALGAGNVVRVHDLPPADGGGSPLHRFFTLGLAPNPGPQPTQIVIPSLGGLDGNVDPATFAPALPYEPANRLLPEDGYWAAKRIAAFTRAYIALSIDAGKLSDRRTQQAIQTALERRRIKILSYWFGVTTPIELVSVSGATIICATRRRDMSWCAQGSPSIG